MISETRLGSLPPTTVRMTGYPDVIHMRRVPLLEGLPYPAQRLISAVTRH
jgi:hypothetical protein